MQSQEARRYIWTETAFSTIGSTVVGTVVFMFVFGLFEPVPTRGVGAYAFDFLPQGFMTALICAVAGGGMTRARIRKGAIAPVAGPPPRISSIWGRGIVYGLAALVLGSLPVIALILASGMSMIDWSLAVTGKIVFGAAVAMIVTPLALRDTLRESAVQSVD
ncbi:hypothetical protein [Croceicoccus bisphenolivorans]|uniref:hypothetical protein n=1 Tax=Croceicoccus bisphenolivorans TaxID=1783232 RepID=UPI00082D1141|nr:hypothetical protein [Croceicoccus bisphenolivorans]